jgi:hypothetical protein
MTFYSKWVDFVCYPNDINKAKWTKAGRLDCSKAVRTGNEQYDESDINERGYVVTEDRILLEDDDEFETMEITESGRVLIFTKKRVWFLYHLENMERLMFLPRHPQYSHFEGDFNKDENYFEPK